MATDIDICNLALSHFGARSIDGFNDGSEGGRLCGVFYEQTLDEVLRAHAWNFAIKRTTLSRLAETPTYKYGYAFQLPQDYIRVLSINKLNVYDESHHYEIEKGRELLTDYPEVLLRYVYRMTDATKFDDIFIEALSLKLASKLSTSLSEEAGMSGQMLSEYKMLLEPLAKFVDASEDRPGLESQPSNSRLARIRRQGQIIGDGGSSTLNTTSSSSSNGGQSGTNLYYLNDLLDVTDGDRANGYILTWDVATLQWTAQAAATGGDVTGPTSATDNVFPYFDGTTGKLIKDSTFSSGSFATAAQGSTADAAAVSGGAEHDGFSDFVADEHLPSSTFATSAQGSTADAALPKAGGEMSGNITMAGSETVDGRDISADGTALDLNTTHRTSDGSDHTFIDQSVVSGGSPTFAGTNITGTATGLTAGNVTTNANLTGHVTSVGNAAELGSFTLAQLNTAISDGSAAAGDVVGPASATNNAIAIMDSTTGKLIKQSSDNLLTADSHLKLAGTTAAIDMAERATGPSSQAGRGHIWVKDTVPCEIWFTDDAGTETLIGFGSGDALTTDPLSQFAATTSLQLKNTLSDSTGSGSAVFANSPTLVTPSLGTPSALVGTNITGTAAGLTVGATTGVEAGADVTDAVNIGTSTDGATAKTTLVDADAMGMLDSAAANVWKKITWANIKATLKTYFDTLYATAAQGSTADSAVQPGSASHDGFSDFVADEHLASSTFATAAQGATADLALPKAGGVATGTHDFGGADDLEIPNSATPTVDTNGQIAIDTTVADFSAGVLKYFSTEEMAAVAMPIAQLTTPTNGYVVSYNSTNNEFELVAQSAGGGSGEALEKSFTETGHGFTLVGTPVYNNAGTWTKADASAAASSDAWGLVAEVTDVNTFVLNMGGYIDNLVAYTANEDYYVSETAGELTTTPPTTIGAVDKPILLTDSTTTGMVAQFRGFDVSADASFVGKAIIQQVVEPYTPLAIQNLSTTHADVDGSDNSFTPVSASSEIHYQFAFHVTNTDADTIQLLHMKLMVDGVAESESYDTWGHGNAAGINDFNVVYTYVVPSWGTSAKIMKMQARDWSATYDVSLHKVNSFDAGASSPYRQAVLRITEYL